MSNNKSLIEKIKASFSGRKFRSGAYASILSAIVIIIILVANLIVSKMDIQLDLTASSKYSITEDTKDVIKELEDDITIYYMVQQGSEISEFVKIAEQYDKSSDKITLVHKDPVLYPKFGASYVEETVTQNSFIVVNNKNNRAKYIDYQDMIVQEFDYQTYNYKTTGTDTEGKLTSAILYVTNEELPNLYVVQGHQEPEIPESFSKSLDKMNVNMQTISTVTESSIPEDCDILYINSPKKDFTDEETKIVKDYLAAGGSVIVTVDYTIPKLKNLQSILEYYGINVAEGIVLEGKMDMHMTNNPNRLLPELGNHEITKKAEGSSVPVYMPNSSGLKITDTKRSTLTITPLLSTSDKAYSKVDLKSEKLIKEDGDINGPFYLGLLSTDYYKSVTSNLIVYSSEYTFAQETSGLANGELLTGTIGFLTGNSKATVSIPAKSYGENYIFISPTQSIIWGVTAALGIPLVIFIIGSFICLRRRKK